MDKLPNLRLRSTRHLSLSSRSMCLKLSTASSFLILDPSASKWKQLIDLAIGSTVISSILSRLSDEHPLHGQMRSGACASFINGVQQAHASRCTYCCATAANGSPAREQHEYGDQLVLIPFLTQPAALPTGESRCSVLGTVEGVINHLRQPTWTDEQCTMDAMTAAPRPAAFLEGIVAQPLIRLFLPQVLLSRVSRDSGLEPWRAICGRSD